MRDIVTALARVAGGLVWLIPVLQCLTYHYGDGTYFRGTVDSTGRPEEGELYTKDQQLRLTLQKDGHLVSTITVGTMEAGEEVFSMGGECGMKAVTPTPAAFFMERLNNPQLQS